MYSEKPKGARGRILPGAQLPGARARVERAITLKSLSQTRGYGARTLPGAQSDSDSEGDQVDVRGMSARQEGQ